MKSIQPKETPEELSRIRLKELYEKWVCPKTKEDTGELLVLEQFLKMVNSKVRLWIRKHNPSSALRRYKLGGPQTYHALIQSRSEGCQASSEQKHDWPAKTTREEPVCYHSGQTG